MRYFLAGLLFASLGTAQIPELTLREIEFPVGRGRTTTQEEGSFTVPVRRGAGNDKLTLRFVRFKSSNPDPGPPIVYLAGGPGGL